jgi:hypothetical protein
MAETWDYQFVSIPANDFRGYRGQHLDVSSLGDQGYEVVGMFLTPPDVDGEQHVVILFKALKDDDV